MDDIATRAWDNVEGHRDGPNDDQIIKDMGVDPNKEAKPSDPMRKPEVVQRYKRVRNWWMGAKSLQLNHRVRRLKDHDAYDGDQWSAADAAVVEGRGQKAIVDNQIKPAIDWMVGTEKRTRIDYNVLPREQDDTQGAETKTKLMKYNSDVNRAPFHRSRASKDQIISGLGWLELGVHGDPEDEPTYYRYEDWRNMWYDPLSTENDLSDARFIMRSRIVDLDIAAAMFPEYAAELKAAAMNADTYTDDNNEESDESEITVENEGGESVGDSEDYHYYTQQRSRVRLIEAWYMMPATKTLIRGGKELGALNNTPYDDENESMKALVDQEYASTYDAIQKTIRCMMWAEGMDFPLQDMESPYRHNRYPFVPLWGYRKKRTNEPYGAVRNLVDLNDDLNKRSSKALYLLTANRAVVDDDATDDWDNFYDEWNRPDGIIKKKRQATVEAIDDRSLAMEHVQLMMHDRETIQRVSGVTDENMGRETNATSGRAITARQDQGHVISAEIFDNARFGVQLAGEIELSLLEQFQTEEKTFRVTGDRGQQEFMTINGPDENGQINDITRRKADFVVDSQAYNATLRQAMVESILELAGKLPPEVVFNLLDLIVELYDIPESVGKEMVQRIRAMNKQEDPNADPNDPETKAKMKAKQEANAKKAQTEELLEKLMIEKEAATVEKLNAEADKTGAEVEKVAVETDKIEAEIGNAKDKTTIEKAKVLNEIEKGERTDMK